MFTKIPKSFTTPRSSSRIFSSFSNMLDHIAALFSSFFNKCDHSASLFSSFFKMRDLSAAIFSLLQHARSQRSNLQPSSRATAPSTQRFEYPQQRFRQRHRQASSTVQYRQPRQQVFNRILGLNAAVRAGGAIFIAGRTALTIYIAGRTALTIYIAGRTAISSQVLPL